MLLRAEGASSCRQARLFLRFSISIKMCPLPLWVCASPCGRLLPEVSFVWPEPFSVPFWAFQHRSAILSICSLLCCLFASLDTGWRSDIACHFSLCCLLLACLHAHTLRSRCTSFIAVSFDLPTDVRPSVRIPFEICWHICLQASLLWRSSITASYPRVNACVHYPVRTLP